MSARKKRGKDEEIKRGKCPPSSEKKKCKNGEVSDNRIRGIRDPPK